MFKLNLVFFVFSVSLWAEPKPLFLFDSGYKIPASVWSSSEGTILEPQMLSAPNNLVFTESLYQEGALSRISEQECIVNTLILGLDTRAGDLLKLSRKVHQEDRVLGSRADAINLLQINRCQKAKPLLFSVHRGNYTPNSCIPDYWEVKKGKKAKRVILANFFNLAGRKSFLACIKKLFHNKAVKAKSLSFSTEQIASFNKIHFLIEVKKNLNYSVFNREEQAFPDLISLLTDMNEVISDNESLANLFEKSPAAQELGFEKLAEIGWNLLSQKLWNRSKMPGSGYERSVRIASSTYRVLAFSKFIFEDQAHLTKLFFPVLWDNLSMSVTPLDWYEAHGGEEFLRHLDFASSESLPSLLVWGPGKDSYIYSNAKELGFHNMDKWKKRFIEIPDLIPYPSELDKRN